VAEEPEIIHHGPNVNSPIDEPGPTKEIPDDIRGELYPVDQSGLVYGAF
jgi:hypothetical protein